MNLEDLIAQATRGPRGLAGKCRLGLVTDDAQRFIEAMDVIEEENPRRVNRAAVQRGLRELGIEVHVTIVQDHFNKQCACVR